MISLKKILISAGNMNSLQNKKIGLLYFKADIETDLSIREIKQIREDNLHGTRIRRYV